IGAGIARAVQDIAPDAVAIAAVGRAILAAAGTCFAGGVAIAALVVVEHGNQSFAVLDGELNRFAQPRFDARADDDPIDNGIDVMVLPRVQLGEMIEIIDLTVDARPHETGLANLLE